MDLLQSVSGLILGLFMWLHMFFVSSILLGNDAMWVVARFFEGYYFFGKPLPWLVSLFVAGIFGLFVLHAWLAVRKFPTHWRQHAEYWRHMRDMRHEDTTLWFVQVITGFGMFFLAPVHLYLMMTHPELIGPFESADRVWSGRMWPLYLVLLFLVELHGSVGLYRLAVKWGGFADGDGARRKLKRLKWAFTLFFLALGLLTLAAYMKLGIEHADRVGERYRQISSVFPPFGKGGQGGFVVLPVASLAEIPPNPLYPRTGALGKGGTDLLSAPTVIA
jgi:fumarate reductase subunit C